MQSLLDKINKHGITGSFKIAIDLPTNYVKKLPYRIKIKLEQKKACKGLIIKDVQGSLMVLDLSDVGISHELLLTGVHEAESTKQIRREIKSGMTILEIGANIGYYSLIEAQLVGEKGKIYAFEPSPINMKLLKTNIALNSLENIVEAYPYGVGSKTAKRKFYLMSKGNMSSFVPRKEDSIIKTLDTIDVEVVSLDKFFGINSVSIDYVRMDVEGFEFEVIKGMNRILTSEKCPMGLFIEIHSESLNNNGSSCKEFVNYVTNMGYKIKKARYRGKEEISVISTDGLLNHSLREKGYWETFLIKNDGNEIEETAEK
jgi:FkbM family methyltransferase